jgi:uncharacterized protein YdeI (YjbR/CyaY-like superfamily)
MNPKVDLFFAKAKKWQAEMQLLRSIVLSAGLEEELKWYQPCYSYNGKNVLIISGFKEYCVLSFIKGVLLRDEKKLLVSPGANSQSVMFAKFTSVEEVTKYKTAIVKLIKQAIAHEKAGTIIEKKKLEDYAKPAELLEQFKKDKELKKVFEALTAGRQRSYLMHFAAAKQSATVFARIEKAKPKILSGKGFNEY